jgi:hypothetical protein
MKIYSAPTEIKYSIDYSGDWQAQERAYMGKLTKYVMQHGSGKNKGKIVSYPVADGYARYMIFSEKPAALIHIPTGDAWHYSMVTRFTMKEVLADIAREEKFNKLFEVRVDD